jgi:hypothetical protein
MRAYLAPLLAVVVACGDDHSNPDARKLDAPSDTPSDVPLDGPPGSHRIDVTLVNRPNTAATFSFLVAFEDGTGAWQLASAPAGDTYHFDVLSPTWSVAWTCFTQATREVETFSFGVAERTSFTTAIPARCTDRIAASVALSGTVSNMPATGSMGTAFGSTGSDVNSITGGYSIPTPPATHDLLVVHAPIVVNNDATVDTAVVRRGLVVSGTTTQDIDYSSAQPTQTATVTAVSTASLQVRTTLFMAGGTTLRLVNATTPPFVSVGLASAQAMTGDVYAQQVAATSGTQTVFQQDWVAAVAAQTFTAPTQLGTVTPTVPATTPYPIIQTSWSAYANTTGYAWTASQVLGASQCGAGAVQGCTVIWGAQQSPAASAASPTNTMPDLSALAGWNTGLQFRTGTAVNGAVTAATSTAGALDFPLATPAAAGTSRTVALATWTVTP